MQFRASKALEVVNRLAEAGETTKVKKLIEPLGSGQIGQRNRRKPRFLFNLVLKAFANAGDLKGAEAWYNSYKTCGLDVSVNMKTFGKLIKSAAKAGKAQEAEAWLWRQFNEVTEMNRRKSGTDAKKWKSSSSSKTSLTEIQMISVVDAFARVADGYRAEAWLQRLRLLSEAEADRAGHCASLMAWAHLGDLRKVALHLQSSEYFGEHEWIALLNACAKSSNWAKALECFQLGTALQLTPCATTYTSLIDSYARSQKGCQLSEKAAPISTVKTKKT